MRGIGMYEVDNDYVDYLRKIEPRVAREKQETQINERKYIGVVLEIDGLNFLAPLSSFKDKHKGMSEKIDFIKVDENAVINLNNMIPVPDSAMSYIDFSKVGDRSYRNLLLSEYRCIKAKQNKIKKNAHTLYKLKSAEEINPSSLTERCNDFKRLESACKNYVFQKTDSATGGASE